MARKICLPRCDYWASWSPIPCDMPNVPVCCIQWTLPGCDEETFTFDVKNIFSGKSGECPSTYPGLDNCSTSQSGSTAFFYTNHSVDLTDSCYSLLYSCSGEIVEPSIEHMSSVIGLSPVVVPPVNCFPAYLDLPELSSGAYYRACFPYLRWYCVGFDSATEVVFEAGWQVIIEVINVVPTPTYGFCELFAVATGTAPIDWYTRDPPFPFTLYPVAEGYPSATVQPLVCNYLPCGDPLDCFASCISGTKDCDGTTPAHKPVIHFMLDIEGCCLSGTYGLTYRESVTGPTGGYLGGKGYQGSASCDGGGGYTLLLHIVLYCLVPSSPGDPNYNDGKGYPILLVWFGVSSGAGTSWSLEISEGVTMSCSDGSLVPMTGTVTDTDCGTSGSGDWAVY